MILKVNIERFHNLEINFETKKESLFEKKIIITPKLTIQFDYMTVF